MNEMLKNIQKHIKGNPIVEAANDELGLHFTIKWDDAKWRKTYSPADLQRLKSVDKINDDLIINANHEYNRRHENGS